MISLWILLLASLSCATCQEEDHGEGTVPLNLDHGEEGPVHLNLDPATWEGWVNTQLVWATREPWTFLYYVLLLLSPFFCVSAFLSWRLGKQIEKQERKRKKKVAKND